MFDLLLILLSITVVVMGDIIWDYTSDLIWYIGLRFPSKRLNFDKRKRPKRKHYKYY